jgi:hypothetical protein
LYKTLFYYTKSFSFSQGESVEKKGLFFFSTSIKTVAIFARKGYNIKYGKIFQNLYERRRNGDAECSCLLTDANAGALPSFLYLIIGGGLPQKGECDDLKKTDAQRKRI